MKPNKPSRFFLRLATILNFAPIGLSVLLAPTGPVLANTADVAAPVSMAQIGIQTKPLAEVLVQALHSIFPSKNALNELEIKLSSISQEILLSKDRSSTLELLGAQNKVTMSLSDAKVRIQIRPEDLKIELRQLGKDILFDATLQTNHFSIEIAELKTTIPEGLFNRQLVLSSQGNMIQIQNTEIPLNIQIQGLLQVQTKSITPQISSINTNIELDQIQIESKIGMLFANGKPMQIRIASTQNGNGSITIEETDIRSELEILTAQLMPEVKLKMDQFIGDQLKALPVQTFPLSYTIQDEDLKKAATSRDVQAVLDGLALEITASNPRVATSGQTLLSDVQTKIIWNSVSNPPQFALNPQTLNASLAQAGNLVQILVRESGYQEFLHHPIFVKRLADLIQKGMKKPGVKVGKSGIRFHAVPNKSALALVVNLEIDIGETTKPGNSFSRKATRRIGNWLEKHFGSGDYVKIPVEMWITVDSIQYPHGSEMGFIRMKVDYPFDKPTFRNTFNYPSNIKEMVGFVRKDFLQSVEEDIKQDIPAVIDTQIPARFDAFGSTYRLNQLKFNSDGTVFMGVMRMGSQQ